MLRADSIPTLFKDINQIITDYETAAQVFINLQNAFCGRQSIIDEPAAETGKPDNRLVNNFCGYITTVNVGYFLGKPVGYNLPENQRLFLDELTDFLNYNDEHDENVMLAKEASVKGIAYEVMYTDADSKLRIASIKPECTIVFHDNTLESNILFAIRYWRKNKETVIADLYDKDKITTYEIKGKSAGKIIKEEVHYFNDVPIIEYPNNDEFIGDFEKVLSLVNAYDKAQSDTANDFEYFTDAYLLIKNMSGTTDEDVNSMKSKRVLLVEGDGDVKWVTKEIQDTATENYKDRLREDIYQFSLTPNLTDDSFSGNVSGVALEYKLWGLEQQAAQKERKFKRGIQRRIELFCNFMKVNRNNTYDWREVQITFKRNMPMNLEDTVNMITKLKGIVSDQTLLAQLPFVEDSTKEIEKMDEEMTVDLDEVL